jgi:hypothetical protein
MSEGVRHKVVASSAALTALVALTACGAQQPTSASGSAAGSQGSPLAVASSDGCITATGPGGDPVWTRGPGPALSAVADRLSAIVDAHPADASGVVICTDAESVEILVAHSGGPVAAEIGAVRTAYPDVRVLVRPVQHSQTELLAEQATVMRTARERGLPVVGSAPDILHDGLVVDVEVPADQAAGYADPTGPAVVALRTALGTTFPVRVRVRTLATAASSTP